MGPITVCRPPLAPASKLHWTAWSRGVFSQLLRDKSRVDPLVTIHARLVLGALHRKELTIALGAHGAHQLAQTEIRTQARSPGWHPHILTDTTLCTPISVVLQAYDAGWFPPHPQPAQTHHGSRRAP